MKTTAKQKQPNAHGPPAFQPTTLIVSFPENSYVLTRAVDSHRVLMNK
jgi:hypothetical protein